VTQSRGAQLLGFDVGGSLYGLPIGAILEVAELGTACGVPTLPAGCVAIVNWNGEALPVIAPSLLLESEADAGAGLDPASVWRDVDQILVLAGKEYDMPWLGLPVDAVLELVAPPTSGDAPIEAEYSLQDGRAVRPLDPDRLAERARQVIEGLAA